MVVVLVGGAAGDTSSPTFSRLKGRLESLDAKRDLVVFTGNYDDAELPAEEDQGRAEAERHIMAHVEATRDFARRGGRVYYLAGAKDFASGGTRAVRRLRAFLNHAYEVASGDSPELDVMPQAGCGDPTLIELESRLGLLLLDSQWWMQDWANDPHANEGCEVKTRKAFEDHLRDALSAYRSGRLIIATHHPVRSDGELGGSFTAQAHLKPAPILGTIWVLARQAGLVEQYQNHPMVRSYADMVLQETQRYGSYVLASGHDANLQYLRVEKQVQIVSGTSGRSASPTVEASGSDYASATPGWAELAIDASGEGEVSFWSGESDAVLFRASLPAVVTPGVELVTPPKPFPEGLVTATFTKVPVWQMGSVMKALVGSFYSDAYALELSWETLNLETERGGLTLKGLGGGTQTNSIKLRDAQGNDWVMRAVTKDSSRVLPWPQNQATFLNRMLDHGYTASHPEAALAIPRLSEALGLLHAEPRLVYLPDQERLGRYRGTMVDELVLLEQRPKLPKEGEAPASLVGEPSAEGKTHFRTTQETIEKLIAKPSKHRVDQEEMLRARLLDIFVGDWDRHQGQWRFAAIADADGRKTYRPIARDRDQVFANYDGLGLFLARVASPDARVLQPFTASFGDMGWLNYNGRNVDSILLNQLSRDRWLAIAKDVQGALTDEVIDQALASWHPETYALDGARISGVLRARRDALVTAADEFFAIRNRRVDVLGSAGDDLFDLWFEEGGVLRLTVSGKGSDGVPFYDRRFDPAQTEEVRIYALEGDDTLLVHGAAATSISIRFVGGPGKDLVAAADGTRGTPLDARAIHLYDDVEGATVDSSITVRDERSKLSRLNDYDQDENHDPDFPVFMPSLGFNPDDGAWLGGRFSYTLQGFKKHPFAARHELGAAIATATLGFAFDYRGLFPQSVGTMDQEVQLKATTISTRNFFGLTDRFVPDAATADFYRVRQGWYEARYGLVEGFGGTWTRVGGQLVGQAINTEPTAQRFISASPDASSGLGPRYFAGARLFAETSTFDDLVLPTRGIALHASVEGRIDVQHGKDLSVTGKLAAAAAFPIDRGRRFVLITRARLEGILGAHPFYFAPTLGGTDLRAYRFQQFAGDVAFSQTTDLRIDVVRIYSGLPSSLGVNLSVDHGRVFGPTTAGNDYHVDFGGGVWWCFLDAVGVSLSYAHGLDGGSRFAFAFGPLFAQTGF